MNPRGTGPDILERRIPVENTQPLAYERPVDANSSGVAWGAVIGGAVVAAALAVVLIALGAGFGLSAVSPWSNAGTSAATVGAAAIIWLIITEALASAMGGYLTGRLRTKWVTLHTDEVHFRDTANGFLAWALAVVLSVTFMAMSAVWMTGSRAAEIGASDGSTATGLAPGAEPYYLARLFRSDRPTAGPSDGSIEAQAVPIFAHAVNAASSADGDIADLAQLVAARTGLSMGDAEARVNRTITEARQAEDDARKAMAHLLLWTFLALLIGAFCASYAATIGGRQRDRVRTV